MKGIYRYIDDEDVILENCTITNVIQCNTCVCVFFPFILDIKFVGRTSRGHTGGRSHRIFHPLSFCCAFSREEFSHSFPVKSNFVY